MSSSPFHTTNFSQPSCDLQVTPTVIFIIIFQSLMKILDIMSLSWLLILCQLVVCSVITHLVGTSRGPWIRCSCEYKALQTAGLCSPCWPTRSLLFLLSTNVSKGSLHAVIEREGSYSTYCDILSFVRCVLFSMNILILNFFSLLSLAFTIFCFSRM